MADNSTRSVTESFIDAVDRSDFDGVARLLHPTDFQCIGPLANFDDPHYFCEEFARIEPILQRVDRKRVFVDGDQAMAVYNIVTTMPGLEFTRIAQWLRVREGLITYLELFFDTHAYNHMFEAS